MNNMLATSPQIIAEASGNQWPSGYAGIVKPDSEGFYRGVLVGAIGTYNSNKEFYKSDDSIIDLIMNKSSMATKLAKKVLYAENGHPLRYVRQEDGTTKILEKEEFVEQLLNVSDRAVVCFVSNVYIKRATTRDKYGYYPDLIYADIKPDGPYAHLLKERMESPTSNCCFSMRWFANKDIVNGVTVKTVFEVVGFDMVTEGGIELCVKDNVLSFENKNTAKVTDKVIDAVKSNFDALGDSNESSDAFKVLDGLTNRYKGLSNMPGSFHF